MSKWTKKDPTRNYRDENKERVRRENRSMLKRFIAEGPTAEPRYATLLKLWFPTITPEEMEAKLMRFRDAVKEKYSDPVF